MGEVFIRMAQWSRADIAISTAVHHAPNVASWWARLGYAREQAKDLRYSLDAYNKALQLSPGLEEAVRGRQRVQALLNRAAGGSSGGTG